MPSVTIPLSVSYNQRNVDARASIVSASKDARLINFIPRVTQNQITKSANSYIYKRPGVAATTITSGNPGSCIFYSIRNNAVYSAFYNTSSTVHDVYWESTLLGSNTNAASNAIIGINETLLGGVSHVVFSEQYSSGSTNGWYYKFGALNSFVGNRTSGSAVVSGIADTTLIVGGQLVSATGFAVGTRVLTVDSATQVTMTNNASSGAATSTTFTAERLAKILDADYPTTTVGRFAFIDGYPVIADASGLVWVGDLNSLTGWRASSYTSANTEPDGAGAGVFRHKDRIVMFGKTTIEFWYNAGNPSGSPLSRVDDATLRIGAPAAVEAGDSIYFIGATANGVSGVYRLNGYQPEKISTPEIDSLLSYYVYGSSGDQYLSYAVIGGQEAVILQYVTGGTALVYYVGLGWGEFSMSSSVYPGVCAYEYYENCLTFTGSAGKIYKMNFNSPVYQDESASYTATLQSTKTDFGTEDLKTVREVALLGSDIQSSGTATLEYSDDDYSTWTTAGTFDLTKINPRIHRCGAFRGGRAWRLTHSANTAFRAQSLKFDFDIGAH